MNRLRRSFDELCGKGAFEMRYLFLYFFPLVRIYDFYRQISRPLAYEVRISSKASATATLALGVKLEHPSFRRKLADFTVPGFLKPEGASPGLRPRSQGRSSTPCESKTMRKALITFWTSSSDAIERKSCPGR